MIIVKSLATNANPYKHSFLESIEAAYMAKLPCWTGVCEIYWSYMATLWLDTFSLFEADWWI